MNQPTITIKGLTFPIKVTEHSSVDTTETAKIAKQYIKQKYGLKCSSRSDSYSGGSSVHVAIKSPVKASQVRLIEKELQILKGATFDGMQDLKEYHKTKLDNAIEIHFMCDFIFVRADREFLIDDFCYNAEKSRLGLKIDWAGTIGVFDRNNKQIEWTDEDIHERTAHELLLRIDDEYREAHYLMTH